ncbi:glycoside hydrolase family 88 protein [Sphingobacterium lumbrici]|uniref:glycoside hydrolase family 88 protein n=1 Tax=Sphingobacterium lumbrici TaxID=2559600 RepID=UPI001129DAD5|nr:glycoside hydrolase family 88 protein [Sphingobacterium lumbrici]
MKKLKSVLLLALTGILLACQSTSSMNEGQLLLTADFVDQQLRNAVEQYQVMAKRLPPQVLPKTYYKEQDSLATSSTRWWTSGFYPGTLLYLYEYSGDSTLAVAAKQKLQLLEREKDNRSTHDLGFMLYCSFGNANRIMPDSNYRTVMLQGAESLISRYKDAVEAIRSWDHHTDQWQFPVIIDNMMNLEFLNWASRESGDSKFANIAKIHANTTLKNHFREDYSSYHVVDYDSITGAVRHRHTAQGARHETAWARGQAWGLYGYVMMFRDTQDSIYLNQAVNIANYILNHPNLPKDGVPYWDFDADDIPDAKRDASAAAIIASALLELQIYVDGEQQNQYLRAAENMLTNLSSDVYKAKKGSNGGFILMHSVGHLLANSEVDVPLTYADYYYVEALMRYRELLK